MGATLNLQGIGQLKQFQKTLMRKLTVRRIGKRASRQSTGEECRQKLWSHDPLKEEIAPLKKYEQKESEKL